MKKQKISKPFYRIKKGGAKMAQRIEFTDEFMGHLDPQQ